MSDVRIKGGRRDTPVIVNEDGRILSTAISWSPVDEATVTGNGYRLFTEVTLTGSTATPLLWVQNDDDSITRGQTKVMIVDGALFSADADVYFEVFVDETYTSGGGSASIVNLNRALRSKAAPVTARDGSAALVLGNDGEELSGFFVGANSSVHHSLRLSVPKGNTVSVYATGANTNKCRVNLLFYFIAADQTL